MEKDLFEIATRVSTPLILGGLVMMVLFLVIYKLYDSSVKDKDVTANKLKLAKMVFRSIITLAAISMIIGAAGWFYEKSQAGKAKPVTTAEVAFYLYLNQRSVADVKVKANNLQQTETSDAYGKVSFTFDSTRVDSLFLEFNSEPLRILNTMNVAVNNLPNRFDLMQQPPPSTTNPQPVRTRIDITKLNLKYIPKVRLSQ
ncbi:MAG: hypothetical protein QM725_12400 [Lacibacter sp.]